MTEAGPVNPTAGASLGDEGAAAPGIAELLGLSATPTFAVMALLTADLGAGPMDMTGSAGHSSPLGGMVAMYLLMAAFHSSAWLKLISGRRGAVRRS
jgi:hypothetical protein